MVRIMARIEGWFEKPRQPLRWRKEKCIGALAFRNHRRGIKLRVVGDRINLHPHLHFLVTEGGVDEAGDFHKIPRIDDSRL